VDPKTLRISRRTLASRTGPCEAWRLRLEDEAAFLARDSEGVREPISSSPLEHVSPSHQDSIEDVMVNLCLTRPWDGIASIVPRKRAQQRFALPPLNKSYDASVIGRAATGQDLQPLEDHVPGCGSPIELFEPRFVARLDVLIAGQQSQKLDR
jgi:hypothetical protein